MNRPTTDSQRLALFPADDLAVAVCRQLQGLEGALDTGRVVQHIRDIAEAVCERLEPAAALGDILFTLNDQLFNVLGFRCVAEEEVAPRHAQLHRVLQQRAGEPLSLGVLYICVGRWLGLPLRGCDFPGRFLVRYHDAEGVVMIDPAGGGIQLQPADLQELLLQRFGRTIDDDAGHPLFCDIDDASLVTRMLRRLKQAYFMEDSFYMALQVQERLMQLLPGLPSGFRERGQLYERLGCALAAAEDYSRYLDLAPDAGDGASLRSHLSQLLREPLVLH